MRNTALFLLLMTAGLAAQTTPYVYVPVNDLRQDRDRAQREWQRTAPDLEAHLTKAPKKQVLEEIDMARAAARRFGEAEVKYLEARLTTVESQIANLGTRGVAAPATLAKQMTENIQAMMQHLSNDRQSIQRRLDQMNAVKQPLGNEDVLTRKQLEIELKLVTDAYAELGEQRDKLETTPNPAGPDLESLRGALVTDLAAMQQLTQQQRERARQSIELFDSYYGNLRIAVQKRPDDVPPASPPKSSTNPAAAPPAKVESDSRKPAASNNRATDGSRQAASAKSTAGALVAARTPDIAGRWTLPENSIRQTAGCWLKSAEMDLQQRNRGGFTGTLRLTYSSGGDPTRCPSTRDSPSNELSLKLEGTLEGQTVRLTFESDGAVVGGTVLKGRLEMRPQDEYRAAVSALDGDADRLGLPGAVFEHRPSPQPFPRNPGSRR